MSEAQDGTVEPFGLYDPTKVDKPLAAADVQSLIDASITDKFDAFRAELLQVLKPVTGDRADGADTRAPSTPARGGGTAVTAGSRTAKSTAGDLLGLSSGGHLQFSFASKAGFPVQRLVTSSGSKGVTRPELNGVVYSFYCADTPVSAHFTVPQWIGDTRPIFTH